MKTEKEIAKDIKALVESYIKEGNNTAEVDELKETIEYMVYTISTLLKGGIALLEDTKKNGLTLNQLEAEGYVRACLTIKNDFKAWNHILDDAISKQDAQDEEDSKEED